jgi:hypothetical protein
MIKQLNKWHQTKLGLLVFGVVELAIAYGFVSLSIDRGNLWWYLLTLIFLVGALQNLFRLIGTLTHGNKAAKARRS